MTDEQFDKAKNLKAKIDELYHDSDYLYNAHTTSSNEYDSYRLIGVCSDGVTDTLFDIPKELLGVIKDWYSDRIIELEAEFEKL